MKFYRSAVAMLIGMLVIPLSAGTPRMPLHLLHSGDKLATSTSHLDVKEGLSGHKYLVVTCSFRLINNPSGFNYHPIIHLFDRSGKIVGNFRFGECELLPRVDDPQIIDGQTYIKIPPNAEKAALSFIFTGNRGEIEILKTLLAFSDTPERRPKAFFPRFHDPAVLNDSQLDEMLAKMTPLKAEIRRCGQYNGVFINGQEIVPSIYYGSYYKDIDNSNFNMVHAFHKRGMNLFSVSFTLGVAPPYHNGDIWLGPRKYDISPIIKDIRSILKQVPDAKILLKFNINQYRGYAQARRLVIRCIRTNAAFPVIETITTTTSQRSFFWQQS